jgi:hypothetical protein
MSSNPRVAASFVGRVGGAPAECAGRFGGGVYQCHRRIGVVVLQRPNRSIRSHPQTIDVSGNSPFIRNRTVK